VCNNAPDSTDDNGLECCCFTGGMNSNNGYVQCSEDQSKFCQGSFCKGAAESDLNSTIPDNTVNAPRLGDPSLVCEATGRPAGSYCKLSDELGLASSGSKHYQGTVCSRCSPGAARAQAVTGTVTYKLCEPARVRKASCSCGMWLLSSQVATYRVTDLLSVL
jgi:hypothetical protein